MKKKIAIATALLIFNANQSEARKVNLLHEGESIVVTNEQGDDLERYYNLFEEGGLTYSVLEKFDDSNNVRIISTQSGACIISENHQKCFDLTDDFTDTGVENNWIAQELRRLSSKKVLR